MTLSSLDYLPVMSVDNPYLANQPQEKQTSITIMATAKNQNARLSDTLQLN
jgi:hypothetical protein